jgi:shikimate dehydrogenase
MRLAGLIGHPVTHSLSAAMHNAAFGHLGIDAEYHLWDTAPEAVADRMASLRRADLLGANVTVPHKQAVVPLLDELTPASRRIGAVNTIVPMGGRLLGDNTDAYGFARSLAEISGGAVPAVAVVVGAGGAARAVLVGLQEAGCERIMLVNRTLARAHALAADLSEPGKRPIEPRAWDDLGAIVTPARLLVNATSVGWHGDELPFPDTILDSLTGGSMVMDLTYRPTALLRLASERGLVAVDGLPMLVYQGVRAFELWTGRDAPVDVMREAVRAEQARRA